MGPFRVVGDQIVVQVLLHLFQGLVPLGASLDAEMLVQQGAVQPFDEAVALWPPILGGAVLDLFELKEQLIRMLILPAAELAAVVAEYCADFGVVSLEEGQHVIIEHMHGRDGQFAGVEAAPGVAAEAVDDGLQIDLANPFEGTDEEGIDSDQFADVVDFDMPFAKLRAEPLQVANLIFGQLDLLLARGPLEPQKALMTGQQIMASPYASDARRTDLNAT